MYIGVQDFWVDSLTGSVALSLQHGQRVSVNVRGQWQARTQHPAVIVRLRDVSLRLRVVGFNMVGEKGTKVPDMKVSSPHRPSSRQHCFAVTVSRPAVGLTAPYVPVLPFVVRCNNWTSPSACCSR